MEKVNVITKLAEEGLTISEITKLAEEGLTISEITKLAEEGLTISEAYIHVHCTSIWRTPEVNTAIAIMKSKQ